MIKYNFLFSLQKFLGKNKTVYEKFVINRRKQYQDLSRKDELKQYLSNLLEQKPFPLPTAIEIETLNKCNGECDFCPVNKHLDPREYKKMSDELFYSIVSQLKEVNYSGYISAYSNNEPLLDKRIFDFVAHIKKELPNAKNFLFTNGILLTLDKFKQLIDNLDYMVIDNYYEKNVTIQPNIAEIAQYCLNNKELCKKVKIQSIDKHELRTNRGGNAKNRKHFYKIKSSCMWPFSQMVIRPDGKISLCCNDALGKMTMGDLTQEKLIDIWYSEKYVELRKNLLESRENIIMCSQCDTFGLIKRDDILSTFQIGKNWGEVEYILQQQNLKKL